MIIATTYEQFKHLPQNKGKDPKTVYKEWLFEEQKLLMMYDSYQMLNQMYLNNFNTNVIGVMGGGASTQELPPIPTARVTYYTPNGASGLPLGYYKPDLDNLVNSYYIYV